jgi:hypothetical protein
MKTTGKNQHSPRRSIKELQRIIDNAPPIKIGNKTPVWENLVARGGFEPPTPGL